MQFLLPRNTFSFFKIVTGAIFLFSCIVYPKMFSFITIGVFFLGVGHLLGAWISMWRAKKLNWRYVTSIIFLMFLIIYAGTKLDTKLFIFIGNILFAIHFLYDEFDLQEELRNLSNFLSALTPTILILFSLCKDYLHLDTFSFSYFIILVLGFFMIEIFFFKKEITWFFIHTKLLVLFILSALFLGYSSVFIMYIFLAYHYLFWFIYPVYKLHTYKSEERDGMIMILILTVCTYVFLLTANGTDSKEIFKYGTFSFYGIILHILTTTPFGYLFGLPKPKFS